MNFAWAQSCCVSQELIDNVCSQAALRTEYLYVDIMFPALLPVSMPAVLKIGWVTSLEMLQLRHLLHATSKRLECPCVASGRVRFVGSFAMLALLKMHKAKIILSFSMEGKVLKHVMWLAFYLIIIDQLLVTGINVLHLGIAKQRR